MTSLELKSRARRGFWLTTLIVVVALVDTAALPLTFDPDAHAQLMAEGVPQWWLLFEEGLLIIELCSLVAMWFLSKGGVVLYCATASVVPVLTLIRGTSVNWLPVASIAVLLMLIWPRWRTWGWGININNRS